MDDLSRRFSNLNVNDPPGRRLDETDNKFYTFREFIDFYGEADGRYRWSIATKEEEAGIPEYESSSEPESYSEDDSEYDSAFDSGYETDEAPPFKQEKDGGRKNKTKSRRKKKKGRKSRRKSRKGKKKRKIRKKKTRKRPRKKTKRKRRRNKKTRRKK